MEIFNSYFNNLLFTQVDEKEGFSIYGACVSSGLGGGLKRYILLFVPLILTFKKKALIHELNWKNLQTRELSYSYKLPPQPWNLPRGVIDPLLNITKRDLESSQYNAIDMNFPFDIILLHNPKKKSKYQYRNSLTLTAAILMFNCVIDCTENIIPSYNNFGAHITGSVPVIPDQNINLYQKNRDIINDSFEIIY
jgi:hypothetical protein